MRSIYRYFLAAPLLLTLLLSFTAPAEGVEFEILAVDRNTDELIKLTPVPIVTGREVAGRTVIGPIGFGDVEALAYDRINDILYGADFATGQLITINRSTGAGTAIGPIGVGAPFPNDLGFGVIDLTFGPNNVLFGLSNNVGSTSRLMTISTTTGAGTLVGSINHQLDGLAYQPRSNKLFAGSRFARGLFELDPNTASINRLLEQSLIIKKLSADPNSENLFAINSFSITGDYLALLDLSTNPFGQITLGFLGAVVAGGLETVPSGQIAPQPPAPPPAPTALRVTPGNQMADLRWDSNADGVVGWNVYFQRTGTAISRIGNAANPTDPSVPTTNTTSFRVDAAPGGDPIAKLLINGFYYDFAVTAIGANGAESPMSGVVTAVPGIGNAAKAIPEFPVLFLHGIAGSARSWDLTTGNLIFTQKLDFGNDLEIFAYGQIFDDGGTLRICTFTAPCVQFRTPVVGQRGHFYTASFGDNNAHYSNLPFSDVGGIRQQGREVGAILKKLKPLFPPGQKFIIVAHSMGGLAARSYIAGLDTSYNGDVARLVTIGTPHNGTPIASIARIPLLNPVAEIIGRRLGIDPDSDGVRDMDPDVDGGFLTALAFKELPEIDYVSIVSSFDSATGNCFADVVSRIFENFVDDSLLLIFLGGLNGFPNDCVVSTYSQDLRNVEILLPPEFKPE